MKAVVLERSLADKIQIVDIKRSSLEPGYVRVRVKAAALNHRDEWARKGLYPNLKDGIILGSDGAGEVSEIGSAVSKEWLGKEVVINPSLFWGDDQRAQSKNFGILGIPTNGTLAEFVDVPADRIRLKPSHLSWEEAAALPLAGLTAYRALFYRGDLKSGQKVLVTGFGGGVAQFASQFAIYAGAKVWVSSSSKQKIERAISLGAEGGFDYLNEDWVNQAKSESDGFDLIIDGAAGKGFANLLKVVSPGGTIVFYGATTGNPEGLDARRIFWNQISIKGSTMGSDQDFEGMLDFVNRNQIHPVVDQVFEMEEAVNAFDRMKAGKQMGKIVLIP